MEEFIREYGALAIAVLIGVTVMLGIASLFISPTGAFADLIHHFVSIL
ncbi:MAG: hypothetical protein K6B67_05380 [Lachnospiraceae bacterium]|nr:hypothetical protein [Lachnospiraceae bacterium]